jgi:hypothetical protein
MFALSAVAPALLAWSSTNMAMATPQQQQPPPQQPPALDAALSPAGALTLGLDGEPWLTSGPTALRQKARWYLLHTQFVYTPFCLPSVSPSLTH